MSAPPRKASDTGRFSKGKSGNPKGRPKAQPEGRNSAFDIVIDRTLSITRDGARREISVEEALQHRTYQEAIAGKRMAQRQVMKWIQKREAWLAKEEARKAPTNPVAWKISPDPDNANAALLILGITSTEQRDPHLQPELIHYKLEPWAVQAALGRRRGGTPLGSKAIADIRRCTQDPDSLRWPPGSGT
ncbi:MAG: hypothetical protein H7245_03065 [Candidatus Saccharibacteria bacterium]|nr:hypothetical protein [Pseudorhodobacter sp.]